MFVDRFKVAPIEAHFFSGLFDFVSHYLEHLEHHSWKPLSLSLRLIDSVYWQWANFYMYYRKNPRSKATDCYLMVSTDKSVRNFLRGNEHFALWHVERERYLVSHLKLVSCSGREFLK